jgi:hypothetical protein
MPKSIEVSASVPRTVRHPELNEKVGCLIGLLREQLRYSRRVAALVKRRVQASAAGRLHERNACLELQRDVLQDYYLVERERQTLLTEIGLLLGVDRPQRLRLAQLVIYCEPEDRDELLDVREELRDVADALESLRAWGGRLDHHANGRIALFLAPETPESKSRHWLRSHLGRERADAEDGPAA